VHPGSNGYYNPAANNVYYPDYHPTNWTAPANTPQFPYFAKLRNRRFDDSFITVFDDRNAPNNRMPSFCRKPFNNAINHSGASGQPRVPLHRQYYGNDQENGPNASSDMKVSGKATRCFSEGTENINPAADVVNGDNGKTSKSATEIEPCGVYEVELASEHIGGLCHDCWPRE